MRKLILMTSAAIIAPLSGFAEDITCTATPNCADLGYTSTTSCDNGVKCPWGEAWYCPPQNPEICEIGSILYSDMTCYKEAQAGKTPIGVVVYVDGLGGGQALSLNFLDNKYAWSTEHKDIPDLQNYSTTSEASQDYASCENSKIIMAAGDKSTYPAAWAANEYSTEGTNAGDWCLPALGVLSSYYNNKSLIDRVLSSVGGTAYSWNYIDWSSSEKNDRFALFHEMGWAYFYSYFDKNNHHNIRPVLEFVQAFDGVCKISQQYTCKGENETGGVGTSCGGRYAECSCAEGYDWLQGKCVKPCEKIGSIFYSDKTCSFKLKSGKTPIGVVVYVDGNGGGQVMALKSIGKYFLSTVLWHLPVIPFYDSKEEASLDIASCENTEKLITAGDKSIYPAAWAVHEYKTEGTQAGDWCLPAAGIFTSIYNNQQEINEALSNSGGTQFTKTTYAWSSSAQNRDSAWELSFYNNYGISYSGTMGSLDVRPVIEF